MTPRKLNPKRTGRPSKYRPEFVERGKELALLGATHEQLGAAFGVTASGLERWLRAHPEFRMAIEDGGVIADAKVAHSLYERACGYSHKAVKIFMPAGSTEPVYAPYIEYYPPDTSAAFIWLKNRQRLQWRDRHEITGADGGTIEMTVEHRQKQVLELLNLAYSKSVTDVGDG